VVGLGRWRLKVVVVDIPDHHHLLDDQASQRMVMMKPPTDVIYSNGVTLVYSVKWVERWMVGLILFFGYAEI
jgi:hypothetical protein